MLNIHPYYNYNNDIQENKKRIDDKWKRSERS